MIGFAETVETRASIGSMAFPGLKVTKSRQAASPKVPGLPTPTIQVHSGQGTPFGDDPGVTSDSEWNFD